MAVVSFFFTKQGFCCATTTHDFRQCLISKVKMILWKCEKQKDGHAMQKLTNTEFAKAICGRRDFYLTSSSLQFLVNKRMFDMLIAPTGWSLLNFVIIVRHLNHFPPTPSKNLLIMKTSSPRQCRTEWLDASIGQLCQWPRVGNVLFVLARKCGWVSDTSLQQQMSSTCIHFEGSTSSFVICGTWGNLPQFQVAHQCACSSRSIFGKGKILVVCHQTRHVDKRHVFTVKSPNNKGRNAATMP